MNCLIHACVPEVVAVVATRKTAELRTDLHGSPNHIIVDCEDGYYERLPRSSQAIILPICQLEKTFTKDGEVMLKDGGTTADNLCDCQQHYRYVDATFAECRQGFGQGSLCACELCASGKKRDDKNTCTQVGLSRAYVTTDSAAHPSSQFRGQNH